MCCSPLDEYFVLLYDFPVDVEYYAVGASYNALVGKDSSRAVALMSLNENDLNSRIVSILYQTARSFSSEG